MKKILIFMSAFVLAGCGAHERTSIRIECIDNKVYLTVWQASFTSPGEDIKHPTNLKILKEEQTSMTCEPKGDTK